MSPTLDEKLQEIKNQNLPVIIFGAATVGEALYKACLKNDIKVECFCDNNSNKTQVNFCDLPVLHTPGLKEKYNEAIFLISASDIQDAIGQLESLGYPKWYPGSIILRNFDVYEYEFSVPADFVEYAVGTAILCQDNYMIPDRLFLRSVDVMVTERCSLRCKDCSNLMRYYKNPENSNFEELMGELVRFCEVVDEVNEFRVIGGEPFMNKDVHIIIKKLADESKVKKIVIYTNGTILPRDDQWEYLKNKKVLFIITDYGPLSKNLEAMKKKLTENGISFFVQKAGGWTDCSKISEHHRDIESGKSIFKNCCAKNTFTLSKRNLFRCPFAANAARLRAVPDFKGDYVDIFDDSIPLVELKKKIRSFLLEKDYLASCDFCNGRSFGDPLIEPAIQLPGTGSLDYKEYS